MLLFLTEPAAPAARTLELARAVLAAPRGWVMLRDKRERPDLLAAAALLEALAPAERARVVLNLGPRSAELAAERGAGGWHAPEDVWRALRDQGTEPAPGLLGVADHDGQGEAFARARDLRWALLAPIFLDKHRPARGLAPFRAAPPGPPASTLRLALGGVTEEQAARLAEAGADGVAVQRGLYASARPAALVAALLAPFTPG